ncbi:hypothetical protein CN425_24895 [Bacillus cereus]|uniref:Uncharacterized protein n=1 Tax=Bacillus cereus TaxID=1396 RepID=A0A2A8PPT3_BACCE|nr:hypothetical protein [Bacillus cereus]PEA06968.1 hypothetical protein CON38_25075 [Bacillus cereus]PEV96839.1 hypothetical protein CN425_24895 [Bacillus cereus]
MNEVKIEDGFKKFLIIWLGELIFMKAFSVGVSMWQTTHSALYVTVVEMAALLPMILLTPVARGPINVFCNLFFMFFYKHLVILIDRKL